MNTTSLPAQILENLADQNIFVHSSQPVYIQTAQAIFDMYGIVDSDTEVAAMVYPGNICTYAYARSLLDRGYSETPEKNLQNIAPMMGAFALDGFPHRQGMMDTSLLIVKNTEKVRKMLALWDSWYSLYPDERLSFSYSLFMYSLTARVLDPDIIKAIRKNYGDE